MAAILVAGCGSRDQPESPPAQSTPVCPTPAQLTAADNGRTVCATVGTRFTVKLPDDGKGHWTAITSDTDAVDLVLLTGSPPISGTQADFVARHRGTAKLTSSRPVCPTASPGGLSCQSMQAFAVTVTVP
jgi:hypothetical protein